ncbi:MAG: hypothetical protein E7060_01200 [Treponema bryantii]|nr:hypothetical protein [Treponema bryantii]
MQTSEFLEIILQIIKNPLVIITVVAMVLVIAFTQFVSKYKKKPKAKKEKVVKEKTPVVTQEEDSEEE